MKTWKYLFAIHELWKFLNVCSQYMNYENIFCNTWIMKIRKCLFAIPDYEKIKCPFETQELWKVKILFAIQEFNIFNIQYKNVCLQYTNYEKMKIFVVNTWIMKIFFKYMIMKKWNCLFRMHELWKYFFAIN